MLLKRRNIVINVPDENKEKIEELIKSGYNEYKTERVQNDRKNSNYKRKTI